MRGLLFGLWAAITVAALAALAFAIYVAPPAHWRMILEDIFR